MLSLEDCLFQEIEWGMCVDKGRSSFWRALYCIERRFHHRDVQRVGLRETFGKSMPRLLGSVRLLQGALSMALSYVTCGLLREHITLSAGLAIAFKGINSCPCGKGAIGGPSHSDTARYPSCRVPN